MLAPSWSGERAITAIGLGLVSSGIWFVGYVLSGACLAFAIVSGPFFPIPLALAPMILVLVFGGSMGLSRLAIEALSDSSKG
jgi:hypothetical protein